MNELLLVLAVAAAGASVAAVVWSLARFASILASRTKGTWDEQLLTRLSPPVSLLVGTIGAALALAIVSARMGPRTVAELHRGLAVLAVVAGAWAVLRLLRFLLDRVTQSRVRFQPAARVSNRLVGVVVYAMVILTALSQYGISVTPLLTGLGIAALAVALALQDTMANFFAGIWIQTGRPLQPGHYVRLEVEKLEGYVELVGWRTTSIRNLSGNTIVLPNGKLAQAVITDYHLPAPDMAVTLRFRVAFEAEPDRVIAVLVEEAKEVAKGNPGVMQDVEPSAQLAALADDAYLFEVGLRVTEFSQQFGVENALRLRVLFRFHHEGIRIPYPTRQNLQAPAPPATERAATPKKAGSTRRKRPPRPKAMSATSAPLPPPKDPRQAEAEKAQDDIAEITAQQEEKAAENAAE